MLTLEVEPFQGKRNTVHGPWGRREQGWYAHGADVRGHNVVLRQVVLAPVNLTFKGLLEPTQSDLTFAAMWRMS